MLPIVIIIYLKYYFIIFSILFTLTITFIHLFVLNKCEMTGRKKDPIWCNFVEIKEHNKSVKAKCKKCDIIMVGLVARMKTHLKKCNSTLINVDEDSSSDSSCIRFQSPSHSS